MLKFLPNHVRSICSASSSTPVQLQLPHVAVDDRGAVPVIDMSGGCCTKGNGWSHRRRPGFTQLSSHLTQEHGIDGAAKLVEAINSPFEKIIRRVYARSGSIVKFAGDSAVVCWGAAWNSSTVFASTGTNPLSRPEMPQASTSESGSASSTTSTWASGARCKKAASRVAST
ncbi:hypothetical protein DFJ73DRAFT_19688 [Zopfochytrium polystomum]|nr:hypothetical protein DFJ73DRAFT_19688 [Zopfochytrium polystomum]